MTATTRTAAAALLVAMLSGCGGEGATPLTPPESTTAAPSTTSAVTTTVATTTTTPGSSTTTPGWAWPPVCGGPCDPAVDVLFTLPVGEDGIGYDHVGIEDAIATGPSAVAIGPDGTVWVLDAVDRRLLGYRADGTPVAEVDLTAYEVASAVDLAAGPDGLLLLDVYVATRRYRVLELDADGGLVAVHGLPAGLHLEDGLSGVAMGPRGELWIELEDGARVAALDTSTDPVGFTITAGYPHPQGLFGPLPGGPPFRFAAGPVEVEVATPASVGGLALLAAAPDGGFVLVLSEVFIETEGISVVQSVHLFDATGAHVGEASFPLAGQFVEVGHPLTMGPDGYTYALLTRPDHVAVARLPYGG